MTGKTPATPVGGSSMPRTWLVPLVLFVGALAIRCYRIDASSLWIDEIRSVLRADGLGFSDSVRRTFGPFDPPGGYAIEALARRLPWISFEAAVRLPMAVAGAVEVVALYFLVRRLIGRSFEAGLAAGWLAVAPFAVRYAQEARYYTLSSALHLLGWLALLRAIDGRRNAWAAWGAVSMAAVYINVLGWIGVLAQAAVGGHAVLRGARNRASVRSWVVATAAPVVAFAPWAIYEAVYWFGSDRSATFNESSPLRIRFDAALAVDGTRWLLGDGSLLVGLVPAGLALVALALVSKNERRRLVAFAWGYVVMVVGLTVILSTATATYVAFRRIEFLVPVLLGLAAMAIGGIRDRAARWRAPVPLLLSGVVALLVAAPLTVRLSHHYRSEKSNYRAAAEAIRAAPSDMVTVIGPMHVGETTSWEPGIRAYLRALGVATTPWSYDTIGSVPESGEVLWITGAPGPDDRFSTESLNDLTRLQELAGDRSLSSFVIPVYVLRSTYHSRAELDDQALTVSSLPFAVGVASIG